MQVLVSPRWPPVGIDPRGVVRLVDKGLSAVAVLQGVLPASDGAPAVDVG